MKISESWLREWVNPNLSRDEICDAFTMAGLEIEDVQPASPAFSGVVVGQILEVKPHPDADLKICSVNVGKNKPLQIVCAAPNVRPNLSVAVALVKATLPHQHKIERAIIKDVFSEGMICSAKELGLSEEDEIVLELPEQATVGSDLWEYLALSDYVLDISITPNRGDCLSVKGLAQELSAITSAPLHAVAITDSAAVTKKTLKVKLFPNVGVGNYYGRVIENVRADASTPIWMKERLRRSGIRSISPIVDVANYVMLELGQPMHAFDLDKIQGDIVVRQSKQGEELLLLDGNTVELDDTTLVIADSKKALAIAGVMGGMDSAVTLLTTNIFLESAYFQPEVVARSRQTYQLDSDSAYRFERGVDATIQQLAIERATQLILNICGGQPAPITKQSLANELPQRISVTLAQEKVTRVLGIEISAKEIEDILQHLHFEIEKQGPGTWRVTPPSYRTDIQLIEDVIEELARLYGYDKIPIHVISGNLYNAELSDDDDSFTSLKQQLCDLGYQEIVSYSFVHPELQTLLDPEHQALQLSNPITSEMAAMRTNLWPGLINTLTYNLSRQQYRLKIFEIATCFIKNGELKHSLRLAGAVTGTAYPEQWGIPERQTDFYDVKGDVEHLLEQFVSVQDLTYIPNPNPIFHPGQSAICMHNDQALGSLGRVHPTIAQKLGLPLDVFLFELNLDVLKFKPSKLYKEVSKFPEIRRDLALLVNEAIPAKDIQDTIKRYAGDWLKEVFIFDLYQGKGIAPGFKSVALAVILQHPARTLIDDEVAELMGRVVTALREQLGAELRS